MATISDNLQQVQQRIAQACVRHGRQPGAVQLLAVSKTWDAAAVQQAAQAGQRAFGENYVQEGVDKIATLRQQGWAALQWHCIGPVQSNKTRAVAEHFDWVHSLDRHKIAQRLSEQRPTQLPPLQACIQVNVDGGANKAGVAPADAGALLQALAGLPGLRLRGLMCIPEPAPDESSACVVFGRARALFESLRAQLPPEQHGGWDTLSMGMSADLEAAIACGSTLVRVGSAIFGQRSYATSA